MRETALHSLGMLGLENSRSSIKLIQKLFLDPDPDVRAMAAWTIGRFGEPCLNDAIFEGCLKLLKDNFWKVRTSVCVTIGCLGPEAIEESLTQLLDALKTGAVNRSIVCETIIKMGTNGEKILVEILKRMRIKDAKLVCPIIKSLELADIYSPTIDFVVEELINNTKSAHSTVRSRSLSTLLVLK